MKKQSFEVKSIEDAKAEAQKVFRVNEQYIDFNVTEKKGLLGLKKTYLVDAEVNVDIAKIGLETLQTMFENMDIKATVKVETESDTSIAYSIDTDENPVLIGKGGKTLEGIQYFLRNLLNIFTDKHIMVLVDIGGYKENRKKQLEILATKTAKEVAKTKIPVKLSPMNAYERRIIHTKLAEWRDVITKSEGDTPNRHLVIMPKKH